MTTPSQRRRPDTQTSLEDTTVKLNRFSRTAVALAAGALLLTACGSD
jgi:hypothetical protein